MIVGNLLAAGESTSSFSRRRSVTDFYRTVHGGRESVDVSPTDQQGQGRYRYD